MSAPRRSPQATPQPPLGTDELLLRIVASAGDAIMALDARGHVLYWNQGAQALFGYNPEEVLGRHFSILVPPELVEAGELERLEQLTPERGSLLNYETKRVTKDGRVIDVSISRTAVRDDSGRLIGTASIVSDISRRKRLERALIEARTLAAIGRLASRIAHEVKNPLTGISGAIQILRDTMDPQDERREIIHEILKEIERLNHTVNDLLHFARPRKPQLQRVNLVKSLEHVLFVMGQEPSTKQVKIERRFATDEIPVKGDPNLIEQAFINLIANACQAMEGQDDPRLIITVAKRAGGAMVTFTDNGPGIPPEIRDKIFDPFFTTKTRGTGLGLAITLKNVEAHSGDLKLQTRPRKGTTFTIFFPEHGGDTQLGKTLKDPSEGQK
ncbi:MAG: ATP-binding protein [Planctomycetota bacterium]